MLNQIENLIKNVSEHQSTKKCIQMCCTTRLRFRTNNAWPNTEAKQQQMKWLWLSWQSSCFKHKRSAVRIQSSVNFTFTVNCIEKTKIKKKIPLTYFIRGSITVQLTSCLTELDTTKQANLSLMFMQQCSRIHSGKLEGCKVGK